jgi:hypothetical protein
MIQKIVEIIQNPVKASIATVTGAVTGKVPDLIGNITSVDKAFQHSVWTVTLVLGMLGIISAIQKQIDCYRKRHDKYLSKLVEYQPETVIE